MEGWGLFLPPVVTDHQDDLTGAAVQGLSPLPLPDHPPADPRSGQASLLTQDCTCGDLSQVSSCLLASQAILIPGWLPHNLALYFTALNSGEHASPHGIIAGVVSVI